VNQAKDRGDLNAESTADTEASRLAGLEQIAGVIWMIIGILQILAFVPFVFLFGYGFALLFVGIWNVYWARQRLTISKVIMSRAPGIPTVFEQHLGMTILFIFINLFFGGVIGVIGCFFDLYVRSQVLKSRSIFEQK